MPLLAPRNLNHRIAAAEAVRERPPLRIVAPVVIALVVGAAIGLAAAAFLDREDAPAAPADRTVQIGPAAVVVSSHWAPVEVDPAARTATFRPLPGTGARTRLALEPVAGPELLPRSVTATLRGSLPSPRAARLAGHRAWTYSDLPTARAGEALSVTVVPTSAGLLSLTCSGPPAVADVVRECASQVRLVTLHGARALAPDPDLAVRLRLPTVLPALDRARVAGRAALRAATTSGAQARAAGRLAAAHRRAARTLAALAPRSGRSRALVGALEATATSYRRLGSAARADARPAYDRSRRAVEERERALEPALKAVRG